MADKKIKCPECDSERFVRTETHEVEMIDNGGSIEDDIVDGWLGEYKYVCAKCGTDVTEMAL